MLAELTLAKLDSTTAPELADKFEVTGFPTMVLFSPDAKPENLKQLGPHNDVFIAAHMANKLLGGLSLRLCASVFSFLTHSLCVSGGHVVLQFDSAAGLHDYRRQSEVTCVLVAPDDSQLVEIFMEAANGLPASYMTATVEPSSVSVDKTGTCTTGEACLLVFHASVPARNQAIAHTALRDMDALTMQAWIQKSDMPPELRQGPFLSSWMQQIILIGSSEDTSDGGSVARRVFDYAAKGSSVYFSAEVLQTELAQKWLLEAARTQENLQLPTMVMLDIEKGKLNRVSFWKRSLTPAEGEDENAVVDQARAWAHDITGLEPKPMDKKPKISESDLANNPHLSGAAKVKEGEEKKVIDDAKTSKKKEKLEAADHEIKLPAGKDLSELTVDDFESKDDYHTWMKNRKAKKEADERADQMRQSFSRGRPTLDKSQVYKMASARAGVSDSALAKERQLKEYVAVVEMCSSIGSKEGAKNHDKGKHKVHAGLDDFMNYIGIWYVNTLRAPDMVYTKGCGCACIHTRQIT